MERSSSRSRGNSYRDDRDVLRGRDFLFWCRRRLRAPHGVRLDCERGRGRVLGAVAVGMVVTIVGGASELPGDSSP